MAEAQGTGYARPRDGEAAENGHVRPCPTMPGRRDVPAKYRPD